MISKKVILLKEPVELHLKVGEKMLGRVVDTLGNPIDGKGPIEGELLKCQLKEKRQELSQTASK